MHLYFDTNVYDDIAKAGATARASERIKETRARLTASSDNLFELFAIPDAAIRETQLHTLTSMATDFDDTPSSFREAQEVGRAFRRHRPDWTRRITFTRGRRDILAAHRRRWRDAQRGVTPDPAAYAEYRRIYEQSVAGARALQRDLRELLLEKAVALIVKQFGETLGAVRTRLDDPDSFWRLENWLAYDGALVKRHPSTRDIADWLVPDLRMNLVTSQSLFLFWVQDVEPWEVPFSHWSGLVAFAQLRQRISHGNAADQLHAAHALAVDVFVTADRHFASTLGMARSHYPRSLAQVFYWDREAGSPLDRLESVLGC